MNKSIIYDVGMHLGEDTAYYLHKGYHVIGIEANPVLAEVAATRFRNEISDGTLIIENIGIADRTGELTFWICEDKAEWSSFNREYATRRNYRHHPIKVHCTTFAELLSKHGIPYYAKIDIEGSDHLCISQMTGQDIPLYISVESYGVEAIDDLLKAGYTKFKVIDQICFSTLEIPANMRYRAYWFLKRFCDRSSFDKTAYFARIAGRLGGRSFARAMMGKYREDSSFRFEDGSSGKFGEDLPGSWISAEKAKAVLREFTEWHEKSGKSPESRWFDIHASS